SVGEIPELMHEAFVRMHTGRPRPAVVQIPLDVLAEQGEATPCPPAEAQREGADPADVMEAAKLLAQAKRPIIWAGGGVNIALANEPLRHIAELLQAPVITTPDGKGAIPEDHSLALGATSGEGSVNALIRDSDAALVVGTRFQQRIMRNWTLPMPKQMVRVDVDPEEIGKHYPPTVAL